MAERHACYSRAKDDHPWDSMAFLQDIINPIQIQCVSSRLHILMHLPQRTDLTDVSVAVQPQGIMKLYMTFSSKRFRCAAEMEHI